MKRLLCLAIALTLLAAGRSSAGTGDMALSVEPMVFEFGASYGGEQNAQVNVSNPGSVLEHVQSSSIDWKVLSDGTVAILRANTNAHSLARYLSITPSTFTLRPGEMRSVTVSVRLPRTAGHPQPTMWSGFLLQASAEGSPGGITPGATLFVYDSTQARHPELQLRSLRVTGKSQRQIIAHIVNTTQTYVRPIAHLLVKDGSKVLHDDVVPLNALLPNSDRWVYAPIPPLTRGRYDAEFIVDYGPSILDAATHVQIP